ncbi:inorganic diphosphatase [Thermomicrobium sp. 4228-Ro]|uniref:inorganic diphosphatase n=1 Tax=Thermomicrobium sp. 4228-Ro TaxID=2993937 RepID=UPI0022489A7E|nr:inorganic diphosphatase [Thermomicrobium sp. 4228-Ro]MCX2726938.1 inorganic diphosphatase [Thermomicrobium sp. 4228-Ro]
MIEDPAGSLVRHMYDPASGTWRTFPHPHARRPWPANYGYLVGTYNPSDDDALDVIVLAGEPLPTGTRVTVRPVGLLRRASGDDKIVAVRCDDPRYGSVRRLAEVPAEDLDRILGWFADWEQPPPELADEQAAWATIEAARCS